ncbi:heme ABC transporter ATP-binding protein [Aggregatibacter aphrophilus NJ8700]|uniref:Cytochrome c biogenesis ATP-binding export protein CcmA n=2 Tax=Aggregatibacter aphrophilus TaxID=732 RepID=A0A336N7N4_AGGAP|nr:cytochrome c biogenesis heme-transporting ATPase CcmA [Aggregatibacter aphrophilus]ACS96474.1 heme ABC exporter, ATP-binding protein CcmA [Aggregatibacter aphrophilus NJ8700]AKS63889.1 heme ABC transporter ATP-binding protein [Aggregatibacter aphrophilus NJ8700]EHB89837.1 cytochrome c biogenesis ATP-binding export protein CcmA [Aggregatibacter aphrophilus F0387]KNE85862.1 heme ABC transporter ATP-binding protein [Aggregatibacter aphrophilus ATCC 33389]OBY53105.1 heme ABC transporter ATP-bin
MHHQLIIENLACQRGDKVLFHHLNLQIQAGDFVQIEGHNGIGKTSLLRIVAGLAIPLEGKVRWNSEEIFKQREAFNYDLLYLGHQSGIKPELNAWENLCFYQQISHCHQGDEILWNVLQTVGLLGREDIPAAQLSAGQQKRIALARLWLSEAPLWILDEPFNAIDKKGVAVLTALFEQHAQRGGIVILTSHQEVPSAQLKKINLEQFKCAE